MALNPNRRIHLMSESTTTVQETPEEIKRRKSREKSRAYRAKNPENVKRLKALDYQRHKESSNKRAAEWRKKNPEKARQMARKSQAKRAGVFRVYVKKWWAKNAESQNRKARERWERNKEEIKKRRAPYQIHYRTKNKERLRVQNAAFYRTPKGKAYQKQKVHARRAVKHNCACKATAKEIEIFLAAATHCAYCRQPFSKALKATLDHKVPFKQKGSHSVDNFAAACLSCNCRKHAKTPEQYAAYLLQITKSKSSYRPLQWRRSTPMEKNPSGTSRARCWTWPTSWMSSTMAMPSVVSNWG